MCNLPNKISNFSTNMHFSPIKCEQNIHPTRLFRTTPLLKNKLVIFFLLFLSFSVGNEQMALEFLKNPKAKFFETFLEHTRVIDLRTECFGFYSRKQSTISLPFHRIFWYHLHGVFRSMLDRIVVQLTLQPHMANWMQCQKTCDVIFYRGVH